MFRNNIRLKILMAIILSPVFLYGQFYRADIQTNANFYEMYANYMDGWTMSSNFVEDPSYEGSEFNHFQKWSAYWGPRLSPTGNFEDAAQAIQQFANSYNINSKNSAVNSSWTELGPSQNGLSGVGQIKAIAFDPNDATGNTIYVGAPVGGVWKSTDAGISWTNQNTDQQFARLGASSIAIDPYLNSSSENNIYVGTGDIYSTNSYSAGVYRSTDGGTTWHTINSNFYAGPDLYYVSKILLDPTNPNVLFAATSVGIYMSINRNSTTPTWTKVYPAIGDEWIRNIHFEPGNTNTLYASGSNIIQSSNGGTTWSTIGTVGSGLELVGAPDFLGNLTHPNFPDKFIEDINIAISNDNAYLYAIIRTRQDYPPYNWNSFSQHFVYRYDISAQTWSLKNSSADLYRMPLIVSPYNNQILIGGNVRVAISTNGGTTWTNQITLIHDDFHVYAVSPTNPNHIYVGCDGGFYRMEINSTGNFLNKVELNEGLGVATIYGSASSDFDPYQILVGHQDNGLTYRKSGLWTHFFGTDGMDCLMDPTEIKRMYATTYGGGNGTIHRSQPPNGNEFSPSLNTQIMNYSLVLQHASFLAPFRMSPSDSKILFQGRLDLWKCEDATQVPPIWTEISDFPNQFNTYGSQAINSIAVSPSNENIIYLSMLRAYDAGSAPNNYYRLFKTTQGGGTMNWVDITPAITSNYPISSVTVSPIDPEHIWITYSGYINGIKVKESFNGGSTWLDVSTGLPNLPVNCMTYEYGSNDGLYIGTDVGVYFKNNLMSSWQPFMTNLPNVVVSDLDINYSNNSIRAATYGRGLWESSLACPDPLLIITGLIPSSIQEANIVTITDAELLTSTDLYVRGVEAIIVSPQSGEVILNEGSNAYLFIHNCEIPGNSWRGLETNYLPIELNESSSNSYAQNGSIEDVAIYPNPTSGKLIIEFNKTTKNNKLTFTIGVFDLTGKSILSNSNLNVSNGEIDISNLSVGVYFLVIKRGESIVRRKIIKY